MTCYDFGLGEKCKNGAKTLQKVYFSRGVVDCSPPSGHFRFEQVPKHALTYKFDI